MVGKIISHYEILEKLGGGGMGVVYKALDTKLDRFVALKFLPRHIGLDDEEKKRFIQEAKAASALDHQNICNIHEIDETIEGQLYIVMAYYDGTTLKKKIEHGPIKFDETLEIAIQIAKGLDKAHKKEIVHRDIKPANIMLTTENIVKIVDFGLAKLAGQTKLTNLDSTVGTIAYMSPEQAQGNEIDNRTDIWSCGVVLYELITGQLPFKGDFEQAVVYSIINENPEPMTGLRTGVPMELERIVNKCLEKDQNNRYQHIDDLVVDLSTLKRTLDSEGTKESEVHLGKKVGQLKFQKQHLIPIGLLGLFICIILFFLFKPSHEFSNYERAYFETHDKDARDKSRSKRTLNDVKAHYYFLYSANAANNFEFPEEVTKEYQQLLKNNSDSPEAHFYLGLAYLISGKRRVEMDSSWILIHKAEKMGLSNLYMDLTKQRIYSTLALPGQALEVANQLILKYPDNPRAVYNSAIAFQTIAFDTAKAEQYYKTTIDIYPKYLLSYLRLSRISLNKNDLETAKNYIDRASEINKNYYGIVRDYARFYQREGRFEQAEECLQKAIQSFGKDDDYYYTSLADLYLKQDRIEEGLKIVHDAMEKFPQNRGLIYFRRQFKTRERWLKEEADRIKTKNLIKWHESIDEAFQISKREQKPLLIDFYTSWCHWCRILDEKTYPDAKVQTELTSFVPVKVNAEIEIKFAKKYKINSFPTLLVVAEDGKKVYEISGYKEPRQFLTVLKDGMSAYEQYHHGLNITPERLTKVTNLNDAMILAKTKKVPIMAVISSKDSKWSEKLNSQTVTDPVFQSELTEIIYVNLDQATNRSIVKKWDVTYFPTILFLNEQSELIYKVYGYQPPNVLSDLIEKIKTSHKKKEEYKGGIRWLYDYEEAKLYALLQKKDIFVNVTADWSSISKRLKKYTFSNPSIIEKLNNEYISLELNDERDKEFLLTNDILILPTLLILDPSDNEICRETGTKRPAELITMLDVKERKRIFSILGQEKYRQFYHRETLLKALRRRGMFQSTINLSQKQLEDLPEQWETIIEIGNSYSSLNKHQQALSYYQKALETPGVEIDQSLISRISTIYLKIPDIEGLKKWFNQTIKEKKKDIKVLSYLNLEYSEFYEILQDKNLAIEKAKNAVEVNPDLFTTHLQLGRLYYHTNKFTDAKKHLNIVLKQNKQDPESCFYLGLISEKEGK